MREKKISIKDLEVNLCEGVTIDEMLGSDYDCLRVDELNRSYKRGEDAELNNDFRDYFNMKNKEESQKAMKES